MKSAIARSPFLIRVIVIAQCVGVSLAARRSRGSVFLNTISRWSPVYRRRFGRPPLSPATFAPHAARMFSAEIVELPPLKLGSASSQLASALWMTPIWFVRNSMNGGEIASPGSPNMLLCHGSRVAHSRIPLSVSQVSPNHAFNRTRRYGPSTWRASVAAGRLTWSCYTALMWREVEHDPR